MVNSIIDRELPGLSSRWMQLFFIVTLSLSVYAVFKIKPFTVPDESAHYFRALEVSKLHLINYVGNSGVLIPCEEYKVVGKNYGPIANYIDVDEMLKAATSASPCLIKSINTAGAYSPFMYIFSGVGFAIADQMQLDYVIKHIWGRMFNAFGNTVVVFLGLCMIRNFRPLLAAVSLIPMGFLLRSSLSADAVTNSICLFYICWVIRCMERRAILNKHDVVLSVIFAILVGLTKPPFSLLPFAILILADRAFSMKSQIWLLAPGFFSVITAALVTKFADTSLIYVPGGLSIHEQFFYVIHHPINFLFVFFNTMRINFSGFVDGTLGGFNIITYSSVIAILCITTRNIFSPAQRFFIFIVAFVMSMAISAVLYLDNTPLGHTEIYGLSGRYFLIPLTLFLLSISFNNPKWIYIAPWIQNVIGYGLSSAIIVYCLEYERVLMAWGMWIP